MECAGKHTSYDPPLTEFCCPKCQKGNGYWYVEECHDDKADEGCPKLHVLDQLICSECGHGESGKVFSARIMEAKNRVKCPTCKGRGHVDGRRGLKT